MARFRVGERVVIPATGEAGVITVDHAGSEPRKYTVQLDAPFAAGAESARSSIYRIYLEDNLEPAEAPPGAGDGDRDGAP